MEIIVDNINHALGDGLNWLLTAGIEESSRNGPVIVSPDPVMTTYKYPCERVLFSPLRNANPWFHFFESLHMLAGRDDIDFLTKFNKNFGAYSDDGKTQHGAYGYRWRRHFGYDQLPIIIEELRTNPSTRRAVLQMWDASPARPAVTNEEDEWNGKNDLRYAMTPGSKDAPCNTHIYFDARGGVVNMTVLCRSNDAILGCYGANVVHFSMLQEYVAAMAGYPVGVYRQFSNNFHLYTELYPNLKGVDAIRALAAEAPEHDYYDVFKPYPLVQIPHRWDEDLARFMQEPNAPHAYYNSFFPEVVSPMFRSWHERKTGFSNGLKTAMKIVAEDWQRACCDWIARRESEKKEKEKVKTHA